MASSEQSLMAVGRIRTSHGVKGEVKILSYSGEWDHFQTMKTVTARKGQVEKTLEVESTRWSGEQLLFKFRGVDQPEVAKTLADFELWVPRDQAAPLSDGEYYLQDLIGCRLIYGQETKGTIKSFWEGAATELLEVEKTDGSVCVIPFAEVYLGNIDLTGRTIELKVDWILE